MSLPVPVPPCSAGGCALCWRSTEIVRRCGSLCSRTADSPWWKPRRSVYRATPPPLQRRAARHSRNGRVAPRELPSRDRRLSYRFRRVRRSARCSSCPRRWRTICARRSPTISIGIRRSSRTRFISMPRSSIATTGAARFTSRWWRRGAHRSMRPSNRRSRSAQRSSPSCRNRPARHPHHDSTCCRTRCGRTACGGSVGRSGCRSHCCSALRSSQWFFRCGRNVNTRSR